MANDNARPPAAARGSAEPSLLLRLVRIVTALLRLLLWPLRQVSELLFPPGDWDGLTSGQCQKAVRDFVSYVRSIHSGGTQYFVSTGYHETLQEISGSTTSSPTATPLLLIYLHSSLHRDSDPFVRRTLCDARVADFLSQDLIAVLGVSIHTAQGQHLANLLQTTAYPSLTLLSTMPMNATATTANSTSSTTNPSILWKLEGQALQTIVRNNDSPEQLCQVLGRTYRGYQRVLDQAEAQRLHRQQEATLRREQDVEYERALEEDQRREALRNEALERERQAALEVERSKNLKLALQESKLQNARDLVEQAGEPAPGEAGCITRVRFVLPSGARLERRFYGDRDTLQTCRAFLFCYMTDNSNNNNNTKVIENIGLSTNYPKRTFNNNEDDDETNNKTLEELELVPQAVLMVQDLDA